MLPRECKRNVSRRIAIRNSENFVHIGMPIASTDLACGAHRVIATHQIESFFCHLREKEP